MSRQSLLFSSIKLIRPLLGIRRADLRHFLQKNGIGWIEDPSNEDQNYERVRVRQSLDEVKIARAVRAAGEAAEKRKNYNKQAIDLLYAMKPYRLGECYVFDTRKFNFSYQQTDDGETHLQLMGDLATLIGGSIYLRPPPLSLRSFLAAPIIGHRGLRLSWAGCIIERRQKHFLMWRERRNLKEHILPPKTSLIWDQRYHITNNTENIIHIRPPMKQDLFFLRDRDYRQVPVKPPINAHMATPVVSSQRGDDFPVLHGCFFHHHGVELNRILKPYNWLVCEDDIPLVNRLQQLFYCTIAS